MNNYYLLAFVSYFAFFLCVSIFFYRKNRSVSSFLVADRSINYWVTALTTQASDMSDWLFMAYPGLIYGVSLFNLWIAVGLVTFMFLNWHFIAPRLRTATEKHEALTLASFFEKRFNDGSGTIRLLTLFFTTYFIVYYIGAELVGLGRVFEATFGIHYNLGVSISITLVVANIIIGGFVAAAWGDAIRGLFLAAMIIIVPILALIALPNTADIVKEATVSNLLGALIPDTSLLTAWNIISLSLGWGLGYFGSPHILMNFMTIDDPSQLYKAKYVGLSWMSIVLLAATAIGLIGQFFFVIPLYNRELVYVEMVRSLFHPFFAGLILCAIVAATMSVMTAQILATASLLSEDFFKPFWGHKLTETTLFYLIRGSIVALPVLAFFVSYGSPYAVNDLIAYAWSGLGLAGTPAVLAALFMPNAHKRGIIAAITVGGLLGIIWPRLGFTSMPLLPGTVICMALIYVLSYGCSREAHQT